MSPNNFHNEIESAVQQLLDRVDRPDLERAMEGVVILTSRMSTIDQHQSFRDGLMTSLKILLAIATRNKGELTIFEALPRKDESCGEAIIALAANVYAWDRFIEVERSLADQRETIKPFATLVARIKSIFNKNTTGDN